MDFALRPGQITFQYTPRVLYLLIPMVKGLYGKSVVSIQYGPYYIGIINES